MKLIISAQDPSLESQVDTRFGRCPWLILFDTDTNQWEASRNPGITQSGGAGVAAAQFVVDKNVDVVISGDFGPNASRAFHSANIMMRRFNESKETVEEVIDQFKNDKLRKI